MAASVFYWGLDSQNTRLVECGVVRMGEPVSTTTTLYFIPMSKLIAPSSSVTSGILQDSIITVIL